MIIDWEVYPWHGAQNLSLGCVLNWGSGEAIIAVLGEVLYGSFHSKIRTYTLGQVASKHTLGNTMKVYSLGRILKNHTLDEKG